MRHYTSGLYDEMNRYKDFAARYTELSRRAQLVGGKSATFNSAAETQWTGAVRS
jgi:hypothetical protein